MGFKRVENVGGRYRLNLFLCVHKNNEAGFGIWISIRFWRVFFLILKFDGEFFFLCLKLLRVSFAVSIPYIFIVSEAA